MNHHYCLGIVNRSGRYMKESRHLRFDVVQDMGFYAAFSLAKLCPLENGKAQRYGRRIKRVDIPVQFEDIRHPFLPGMFHHEESEFLKDAVVSILVSCGESSFGDGLAPHAKVIALRPMSLQRNDQVP